RQVVKQKYFQNVDEIRIPGFDDQVVDAFSSVPATAADYRMARRKARVGQSLFRARVLRAYEGRCCITGETCAEVVEAAHIEPYINVDSNHPQNGLPLRLDLHALFDGGLLTIDSDLRVKVSPHLKGESYRRLAGNAIRLPKNATHHPSRVALEHHWQVVVR